MAIDVSCPSCGSSLQVSEQYVGKRAKCPKCGNRFTITLPSGDVEDLFIDDVAAAPPAPPIGSQQAPIPHHANMPPQAAMQQAAASKKRKNKPATIAAGCFTLAVIAVCGCGGFFMIMDRGGESAYVRQLSAWTMAKQFVTQSLRSPSTASFESDNDDYQDPTKCVLPISENTYRVHGWVDSQNGFGATVRSYFVLTVRYNKERDTWSVVEGPDFVSN